MVGRCTKEITDWVSSFWGTEKSESSAMAAYASLLSLGHILDRLLQHPPRQRAVLGKAQIDSLLESITFLEDFLEEFSVIRGDECKGLEGKISRSAYAAEDIIESRVVDQILEDSEAGSESSSTLFCQELQKVIEEFDSMKKDVMKIKETEGIKIVMQPTQDATAGSFAPSSKNTMVGFDEDLVQIMDRLTGDESNLQILSIVGMGGMGKTTLARNVFENPSIVHHFDLHAWATISQQYSAREILLGLLKDIGEENTQKNNEELGLCLHRGLFDRRYFIVMDDIWSIEVWDNIKRYFPDNNNGSRVLITTRLSNVADDFCSCTPHRLHFLDEDQSWALFCDKVFGKEGFPPELEEVGKTIVRNCGGLPLAIAAISGLLAKSSPTVEYWESVANDTYSALNMGGGDMCFEILSLSYKHLPVHLKPCFLYMAIFPEDHKIVISRLVKLWVAEGILRPISDRSLKETADDNLKELIDRNLIMIHKHGSRNKMKLCTIHDLIRDLCLREAQKENFLCATMMMHSLKNNSGVIGNKRQLIIQRSSDKVECQREVFDTCSLACSESKSTSSKLHRLLRELNMGYEEIVRLVNSTYIYFKPLCFPNESNIIESLSLLWNLQTVTIVGDYRGLVVSLPAAIWEMPQLMHLKIEDGDFHLPDPPCTKSKNGRRDIFVLKNLQTLYKVRNLRCTDEVVGRIPNLRKLGITYREFPCGFGWDQYEVYNLAHLHNLESLYLRSAENVPQNLCFPRSLKKLSLFNCGVAWKDLTAVGSLPHLEVLYLKRGAVKGREWNPVEGQFLQLMSLRIEFTDLENWTADSSHFPHLENLRLVGLENLKKIPLGIGEIATLGSILLVGCSDSANSSAEEIQQEQEELGNSDLRILVRRLPRWSDFLKNKMLIN